MIGKLLPPMIFDGRHGAGLATPGHLGEVKS